MFELFGNLGHFIDIGFASSLNASFIHQVILKTTLFGLTWTLVTSSSLLDAYTYFMHSFFIYTHLFLANAHTVFQSQTHVSTFLLSRFFVSCFFCLLYFRLLYFTYCLFHSLFLPNNHTFSVTLTFFSTIVTCFFYFFPDETTIVGSSHVKRLLFSHPM